METGVRSQGCSAIICPCHPSPRFHPPAYLCKLVGARVCEQSEGVGHPDLLNPTEALPSEQAAAGLQRWHVQAAGLGLRHVKRSKGGAAYH